MIHSDFENLFPHLAGNFEKLNELALAVESKSKEVNITAIRDFEGIWQKHIIDSLEVSKVEVVRSVLEKGVKVLDLGTGGGFPGLPIAISYPNSQFTLLDSTRKKVQVVDEFVEKLEIQNVQTIWGRAEELSKQSEYSNAFDLILARAVAYLPELIVLSDPFLAKGGKLVCYKTFDKSELIAAQVVLKRANINLVQEHKYGGERVIWVFEKN